MRLRGIAAAIVLAGAGVFAPSARATTAIELFADVCLKTLPSFDGGAARLRRWRGIRTDAPQRVFAAIEVERFRTWLVNDEPPSKPERFLVGIARGSVAGKPARSCFVADKRGFQIADLQARYRVRSVVPGEADPVFMVKRTEAEIDGPGGRSVSLTLIEASRFGPESAPRYGVVTIVSPDGAGHGP